MNQLIMKLKALLKQRFPDKFTSLEIHIMDHPTYPTEIEYWVYVEKIECTVFIDLKDLADHISKLCAKTLMYSDFEKAKG